jgi:hypothetical protein
VLRREKNSRIQSQTQQDLKYLAPFFHIKAGRFSIKVVNKKILAHEQRTHLSQVKHGGGNIV